MLYTHSVLLIAVKSIMIQLVNGLKQQLTRSNAERGSGWEQDTYLERQVHRRPLRQMGKWTRSERSSEHPVSTVDCLPCAMRRFFRDGELLL